MRSRVIMVLAIVAVVLGGVLLVPAAYARLAGDGAGAGCGEAPAAASPRPRPSPPPPPTLAAGPVSVDVEGDSSRGPCWTARPARSPGRPT